MLKPGNHLATLCSALLAATFLYGCGSTEPDLDVAPTYDDSPLQFGISFSGSQAKFSWDMVEGASQYRLTQTAGDEDIIAGREFVTGDLSAGFDISTVTYDAAVTEFLLEAFNAIDGWQMVAAQNGLGTAVVSSELKFSWIAVEGVTEYRLTQLEGDFPAITGELLTSELEATIDITGNESSVSTLLFLLEAYVPDLDEPDLDEWKEIPVGNDFRWDLVFLRSPLMIEYPSTPRTIAFGWGGVTDAEQYRLTQTAGRFQILSGNQKLYAANEFIDRFQVPVHLFDWAGSRFTLEAFVDGEWVLIGQQDTAGASSAATQSFTETDAYANSIEFRSQLVFGSNLALSEDGKTMAVGAVGETSVPPDQREREKIEGAVIFGSELQFSWDEVAGVTEYCLKQIEGDITIIEDELLAEGLQLTISIADPNLDSSTLVFSLEVNAPDMGCQEIVPDNGFIWEHVQAIVAARNSGAVFLYDLETNESIKIKSPLLDADDLFGRAVALSDDGQILVVSAHREDSSITGVRAAPDPLLDNNSARESGAVYVYLRDGNEWNLEAYIKAPFIDPTPVDENGDFLVDENGFPAYESGDSFGWSVALSADGSKLAISAILEDGDGLSPDNNNLSDSGAVFVYTRDIDGIWTQEAYLKAASAGAGDFFGNALTMSAAGDYLAISALGESSGNGMSEDDTKPLSGAVYVFARDAATGTWQETSYLKASNAGAGDLFGQSITFDAGANILVIGAPREDQVASGVVAVNSGSPSDGSTGAAYIFERTGAGGTSSWAQKNFYFKASNPNVAAEFGQSVVLSSGGDYLAVGAWGDSSTSGGVNGNQNANTGPGSGAAYIFQRQNDNDSWQQIAFVNEPVHSSYLFFGSWVDFALNGEMFAVAGNSLGPEQADGSNRITGLPGNVFLY